MTVLVQLLFQSPVCPSLPFSCSPNPVLSDPLSVFGLPLFLGKGPFSLWMGCSFRERLDWEGAAGCSRWPAVLAEAPSSLTCQVGSNKGSSHVVCASLPPCSGVDRGLSKTFQADLPRVLWPAWESGTPRLPSTCPSKGGFLVVTQWC